jgi:hypothetical protein
MTPHRIEQARERAGMSHEQAAKLAPDIFPLNRNGVNPEALAQAAKFFRVSLCWISGHDGQVLGADMVTLLVGLESPRDTMAVGEFASSLSSCPACLATMDELNIKAIHDAQEAALADIDDDWQPPDAPDPWVQASRMDDGAWYESALIPLNVCVTRCREQDGRRWVHVSVSHGTRTPKYRELVAVKGWTIGVDAKAIQVFASAAHHVNIHPFCLHLWHCLDGDPLPDFTHGTGSI